MGEKYIRRADAITVLNNAVSKYPNSYGLGIMAAKAEIAKLRYVNDPIDLRGSWVVDEDGLPVCSVCERVALQRTVFHMETGICDCRMEFSRYCPSCGAYMGEN